MKQRFFLQALILSRSHPESNAELWGKDFHVKLLTITSFLNLEKNIVSILMKLNEQRTFAILETDFYEIIFNRKEQDFFIHSYV